MRAMLRRSVASGETDQATEMMGMNKKAIRIRFLEKNGKNRSILIRIRPKMDAYIKPVVNWIFRLPAELAPPILGLNVVSVASNEPINMMDPMNRISESIL